MWGARRVGVAGAAVFLLVAMTGCADQSMTLPDGLLTGGDNSTSVATAVQLLVLMSVLTLAPAILTLVTGFTRIAIVLSFVRNAVGTSQTPPNQVIIGLSLILTFFVMAPTWNTINESAVQPLIGGEISQQEAYRRAEAPVREFMFEQAREKDVALFVNLAGMEPPETQDDVPTYVLVPAFVISELKAAFQMGFVLFVPFLVVDLMVSCTLMAMGMMMLPPSLISLPFKILLFVMVDGWHLVIRSLLESFA